MHHRIMQSQVGKSVTVQWKQYHTDTPAAPDEVHETLDARGNLSCLGDGDESVESGGKVWDT